MRSRAGAYAGGGCRSVWVTSAFQSSTRAQTGNTPGSTRRSHMPPGSLNIGATMKRIVAVVSLISWLWAAWPAAAADVPTVVELWPGKVPDETGTIGPETVRMSPKHTREEVEVT